MVATEKIPLNVHRFDTWNFHLSDSWLNICVDYFTRFSTVGSLRLGRNRTVFVLPKFPSDVNQTLQFHLHRWIHALLIDWFWSCLTKASLHVQNVSFIAARWKRPDFVCPREARKPGGEEGDLCARAKRKFLFYYPKFFLPVPLCFTGKGCLPFTKVKENPVEKWIGHCFSCRSGEKCTGVTDHLKSSPVFFKRNNVPNRNHRFIC